MRRGATRTDSECSVVTTLCKGVVTLYRHARDTVTLSEHLSPLSTVVKDVRNLMNVRNKKRQEEIISQPLYNLASFCMLATMCKVGGVHLATEAADLCSFF